MSNLIRKLNNLDTADIVTVGVGLALVLSDIFLTDRVKVGVASEDFGTCPPGLTWDAASYSCIPKSQQNSATNCPTGYIYYNGVCMLTSQSAQSCPTGYSLDTSGQCLQTPTVSVTTVATPTTTTASPNSSYNLSYYENNNVPLTGLNTGINALGATISNLANFSTTPSDILQVLQLEAKRLNDYFPNNTLVPQFQTAYTTAYNNGTIDAVYQQALQNAYNQAQLAVNFINLVNSGYTGSSATTSTTTTTATATPNITFSGTAGNLMGTLFTITGSGNTLTGSTDVGYTNSGTSNWVSSGTITYSNGAFSGSLGNVLGTLTRINASGNTLNGLTDTGWVLNGGNANGGYYNGQPDWQNSGTITYNPSNNTFSGSIGDISGSTFVLYGQGNQLVSQVNTNTLGSSGSGWQSAGSITATQS
jgi:hypothetical protein